MSKKLLMAGYQLVVYNRSEKSLRELVDLGAERADTPQTVAERSDITITMLPDSVDVEQVILGQNSVAIGTREGSIVVDCSTIPPLVEMKIAEQLRAKNVESLDAPVTGGTIGAERGTLTFMVGGSTHVYERCIPVFKAMGKNIFYMGTNGMGSFTKLCNQVCIGLNLLGTSEALLLASKVGLDPKKTIEVLATGAAGSWQQLNLGPQMLDKDFKPGFKVRHLKKDLRIVAEVCEKLSLPTFGPSLVHELLKITENQGFGESGTSALIATLEKAATYEPRNIDKNSG
jgi:3-hydroxyisobutyrate dehydrogenase-like beta-hydroxyacid dehydrogenase